MSMSTSTPMSLTPGLLFTQVHLFFSLLIIYYFVADQTASWLYLPFTDHPALTGLLNGMLALEFLGGVLWSLVLLPSFLCIMALPQFGYSTAEQNAIIRTLLVHTGDGTGDAHAELGHDGGTHAVTRTNRVMPTARPSEAIEMTTVHPIQKEVTAEPS